MLDFSDFDLTKVKYKFFVWFTGLHLHHISPDNCAIKEASNTSVFATQTIQNKLKWDKKGKIGK